MHRCLFLVIVLSLVGGHAAGLQVVAWTGMLIARAPGAGISSAVRSTFSGRDPCQLCQVVRALTGMDEPAPAAEPKGKGAPHPDDKNQKRPDLSLSAGCACELSAGVPGVWRWPLARPLMGQCIVAPEPPPPRRLTI
jgi:hypothetical protein